MQKLLSNMTPEQFKYLNRGDIIRHKRLGSDTYVVDANYGGRVTAVKTIDVTNPIEWDVVLVAIHIEPDKTKE